MKRAVRNMRAILALISGSMLINPVCALPGLGLIAQAEEESETESEIEVPLLTKDMMDADLYEGSWVVFDEAFALYIPLSWQVLDVSEENLDAGVIFQASDADSDLGTNMIVMANQLTEENAIEDLMGLKQQLDEAGYDGVEVDYINDIPVVSYVTEYSYGICFIKSADGTLYNVQVGPVAEEVQPYAYNIILSLSTVVQEDSTENEE